MCYLQNCARFTFLFNAALSIVCKTYTRVMPSLCSFTGQHQTNQGTLQALQGQAVFIQGQPSGTGQQVVQGQAIMLQNQGNLQGQVQLVTTSSGTQHLQIVTQVQKQAGK